MSFVAFILDEQSHNKILKTFPPKHPDVLAHHVTLLFGQRMIEPSTVAAIAGTVNTVKVVGYCNDENAEALVVEVNGDTIRPNGQTYHITLSIDRSNGIKPVYSNTLIEKNGWSTIDHPFYVTGLVQHQS